MAEKDKRSDVGGETLPRPCVCSLQLAITELSHFRCLVAVDVVVAAIATEFRCVSSRSLSLSKRGKRGTGAPRSTFVSELLAGRPSISISIRWILGLSRNPFSRDAHERLHLCKGPLAFVFRLEGFGVQLGVLGASRRNGTAAIDNFQRDEARLRYR